MRRRRSKSQEAEGEENIYEEDKCKSNSSCSGCSHDSHDLDRMRRFRKRLHSSGNDGGKYGGSRRLHSGQQRGGGSGCSGIL